MPTNSPAPDAELLIATGCAHCAAVLAALADLVEHGRVGRLAVVNIARHPELADARGVRGVPWIRIGPFELAGAHSPAELSSWVERVGSESGLRTYLGENLASGQLAGVTSACRRSPELLPALLALAGDLDVALAVRIGVGAVIEELAPEGRLAGLGDALAGLAASPHPQVRADAAHFLGLAGTANAGALLTGLTQDPDAEVRDIASESLATLTR